MPRLVPTLFLLVLGLILAGCTEPTTTPTPPESPATSPYGEGVTGGSQTLAPGAPAGLAPDLAVRDGKVTPKRFPLVANESTSLAVWNGDDETRLLEIEAMGLRATLPPQATRHVLLKPTSPGEVPFRLVDEGGRALDEGVFEVREPAEGGPGAPVGGLVGPGPANKTLEDEEGGVQPASLLRGLLR